MPPFVNGRESVKIACLSLFAAISGCMATRIATQRVAFVPSLKTPLPE
ncbi:hypothetical protein Rcae01_05834 [Novipirellula caenicola]|uniref:Lipoprotein n=1 Tax=Novipirellula caenicola TaxID=1536901 RepID=A0ABP9VZR9_9BACT